MKIEVGGIYQIQEIDEEAVRFGFQRTLSVLPIGMKVEVIRINKHPTHPTHMVKGLTKDWAYPTGASCYEGRLRPVTPEDPDIETDY